ncbi:MAG: DUF2322 family protein [Methylotenera sp.]|nr:DUF2322 family protein [Methylotenera sp.]MDP1755683.1 DUF2322 family protein [Methylotenera sp.]MDP1960075.1 DUF2322 family protein [Methylotenera sp.]MDP3304435.1 DUF2322 family protein [Methylotenera sp.]MDP3942090.1 DUF2322 family protein [Methylotenera sp.]
MQKFSDVLLTLDDISNVVRIELYKQDGSPAGVIENKPGSQGSVKVYSHLARMYGEISLDAAVEGLSLYAEHTEDAENCPGKHPNVDRLLNILEDEQPIKVKVIET